MSNIATDESEEVWLGYHFSIASVQSGLFWRLSDEHGKPYCQSHLPVPQQDPEYRKAQADRDNPGWNGYNPILQFRSEAQAERIAAALIKHRGRTIIPKEKRFDETIRRLREDGEL